VSFPVNEIPIGNSWDFSFEHYFGYISAINSFNWLVLESSLKAKSTQPSFKAKNKHIY
jgi:hypothetical protein